MPTVDKMVIERKVSKIRYLVRQIEEMDFSKEQFDEDADIQDLVVFRLMQSVEQALDIASHLVAAYGFPRPDTAKDMFLALGRKRLLSNEVAKAMAKAVGFRNIAAHEYMEEIFDVEKVYRDYKDDIRDLKRFCEEVVGILEGEEKAK